MSLLIRALPFYALMTFASLQAAAGQSAVPPATVPPVLPATPTVPLDHQTYTHRAEGEIAEWGTRLHALHEQAQAAGKSVGSATEVRLQDAWGRVKIAEHGLETAGSDTWEGAKRAYEAAANDLSDAWQSAQQHL